MAPKKNDAKAKAKAKVTVVAKAPPLPPSQTAQLPPSNEEYFNQVQSDLDTIFAKYPTIKDQEALPLTGDTGFRGLIGHGFPFDPTLYNDRYASHREMTCSINIFHHNILKSVLTYIPLYRERVTEYSQHTLKKANSALNEPPLVLEMTWANAKNINKGELQRLSPDEPIHGIIDKFASLIRLVV